MADKSIKLLFEVARGGSAGDSAERIRAQLAEIMNEVNKDGVLDLKVRLNQNSLKSIKGNLNNAFSDVVLKPGRSSLQNLRNEIQNHLHGVSVDVVASKSSLASMHKDIQDYFKSNPITVHWQTSQTGTTATSPVTTPTGGTGNVDRAELTRAKSELNSLISQYTQLQKKINESEFNPKIGDNLRSAWQKQAEDLLRAYESALNNAKARNNEAWTAMANTAEQRMNDAMSKINMAAEQAKGKALDSVDTSFKNAGERKAEFESQYAQVEQLTTAYEALKAARDGVFQNATRDNIIAYSEALRQFNVELRQAADSAAASENAIGILIAKFKALENSGRLSSDQIEQVRRILAELGSDGGVSNGRLKKLEEILRRLGIESSNTESKFGKLGTALKTAFSRFSMTAILTTAVYKCIQALRKMITTTVELDDALTQMRIVTKGSQGDMESFAVSIAQTARDIGASMTDLINSATVFARLGYSELESSTLAKYTAMLSNVGDIDVSEAQNNITAIVKAFNIDVDDIESVMDKLVTVGNNFPISVSQISQGMANAGSVLKSTGNSLEQSITLLTAANAATQDISKSSTGLRTIAARLNRVTTELDDLGEVMTEAKYQELLDALTKGGVQIKDSISGELRSTYDILKDLAAVWDQLDTMSQSAIKEALAGTRQQNILTSIINNFREAEQSMDAMENSAGTLRESYDVFLESATAHINTFKAAFQDLARTLFSSDSIKGVVDAGTDLLNGLKVAAKVLDTILKTLGGIKGALYIVISGTLLKNLTGIIAGFKAMVLAVKNFSIAKTFDNMAKNMSNSLDITLKMSKTILGVGAAIAVAGYAAMRIYQAQKQRQEEERKKTEETAKADQERVASLESIISRYREIGPITAEERENNEELANLQQEINELLGIQARNIDLCNKGYEDQVKELEKIREAQLMTARDSAEAELRARLEELGGNTVTSKLGSEMGMTAGMVLQKVLDKFRSTEGFAPDAFFGGRGINESITLYLSSAKKDAAEYRDYLVDISRAMHENEGLWESVTGVWMTPAQFETTIANEITRVKTLLEDAGKDAQNYLNTQAELLAFNLDTPDSVSVLQQYRESIASQLLNDSSIIGAIGSGIIDEQSITDTLDNIFLRKFPEIAKQLQAETMGTIEQTINSLSELLSASGFSTGIDKVKENIAQLKQYISAIDEGTFNQDYGISDVISKFPELEEEIKNAQGNAEELRKVFVKAIYDAPTDLVNKLQEMLDTPGAISDDLRGSVESLIGTLQELGSVDIDTIGIKLNKMLEGATTAASTLSSALGNVAGITTEQYNQLISTNAAFADAIEFNGRAITLNAEKAGQIMSDMVDDYVRAIEEQIRADSQAIDMLEKEIEAKGEATYAQLKELESLKQNVQQYRVMRSELIGVTSAYQQWLNAKNTPNGDTMINELKSAADLIRDVLTNKNSDQFGMWNTDDFRAALKLLKGDINDFIKDGVLDKKAVIDYINTIKRYTGDGITSVQNFINDLVKHGLGTIEDDVFRFFDGVKMDDIAEKLGVSKDMVVALLQLANAFGADFHFDDEEMQSGLDKAIEKSKELNKLLHPEDNQGESGDDGNKNLEDREERLRAINEVLDDQNNKVNQYLDLQQKIRENQQWIQDHQGDSNPDEAGGLWDHQKELADLQEQMQKLLDSGFGDGVTIKVDIQKTKAALEAKLAELKLELEEKLKADPEFDTTDLDQQISDVEQMLKDLETLKIDMSVDEDSDAEDSLIKLAEYAQNVVDICEKGATFNIDNSKATKSLSIVNNALQSIINKIQNIKDTNFTVNVRTTAGGGGGGGNSPVSGSGVAKANGGYQSYAGRTLVGELGTEMYVDPSTNTWRTVGDNGPEFVNLPKGAIVFDHKQTESLLGSGRTSRRGNAMVSGSSMPISQLGGYAGLTSVSTRTQRQSSKEKKNFADEVAYHQHLVAMDKESQEEYLKWLDKAYQKAYKNKKITLEEYRKYQEEVYKGMQDVFMDYIGDVEKYIDNLEHYDGTAKERYDTYRDALGKIQAELDKARKLGLDDTDEYVQQLKQKYWQFYDGMTQIQEDVDKQAKESVEKLVQYRINMIKDEQNKEKQSLSDRLSSLKDFYDKQKQMLRESVEEEDYLSEQAKKRKAVTDIEMQLEQLSMDTSAKAEKRRSELQEQLAEAREELRIFERDHAIDVAEKQFDKLYEQQEDEINQSIKQIDEHLEDVQRLHDEALEDVRTGGADLYREMVDYNIKNVDGTSDAVDEMWEEAYKALKDYEDLYSTRYDGVTPVNYTGYREVVPGSGGKMVRELPIAPGPSTATTGTPTSTTTSPPASQEPVRFFAGDIYQSRSKNANDAVMVTNGGYVVDDRLDELRNKMTEVSVSLQEYGESVANSIRDAASSLKTEISAVLTKMSDAATFGTINLGDIIIQGSASERTVSEIRRAQRESMENMLKELQKLNR